MTFLSEPRAGLVRLNHKQHFQLTNYVQAEYAKSGLPDTAFAKVAAKVLGFEVSHSSVALAREALDIPASREVKRAQNKQELEERVSVLESTVEDLERKVAALQQSVRPMGVKLGGGHV